MTQRRTDRRAEPRFDPVEPPAPDALDLRLSEEDRPLPTGRGRAKPHRRADRREPALEAAELDVRVRRDEPVRRSLRPEPEPVEDIEPMPEPMPPRRRGRPPGSGGQGGGRPARSGWLGWFVRKTLYWGMVAAIWGGVVVVGIVAYYAAHLPPTTEWSVPKRPPNVKIIAFDQTVIGNRGETGGETIRYEQLPPYIPKAVMAIEDRRFKSHWGLDPIGLARAMVVNVTSGDLVQGGSTLTQQLAKNLFLTPDRTFGRKVQEVVLALWLEYTFTKDQILELYLNRVYLGAGAYGIDAAARRYFDKSARQLTLLEAATLAGLLKAPSRLSPARNPDAALDRARVVLAAMVEEGFITPQERQTALSTPQLAVHRTNSASENYVADWVMDLVPGLLPSIDTDIVVETTIDPGLQILAEAALQQGLAENADKKDVSQGAIVSIDPSGAVKALVGGVDYAKSQFNRAVSARRQPGSAFKPFVYLAALESGLTPDTIRNDQPISIRGWKPQNYSKEFRGPVTLRDALAMSLNTVAAQLTVEVGPQRVVRTAQRLGITSKLDANASIALGTSDVSPLEITAAFVPFSNGGLAAPVHIIRQIRTPAGKVLYSRPQPTRPEVIRPATLAMMNDMMQETLITGTAAKARLPGWMAGGKTGTSQEFRDAWFIGYTARLTTGVWFGNDDSSPTNRATGGSMAATVWQRFMIDAHRNQPMIALPGGRPVADPTAIASTRAPGAPVPPASVGTPAAAPPPSDLDLFLKRLFGG